MEYGVYICHKEMKQIQQLSQSRNFEEDKQSIPPFSDEKVIDSATGLSRC